MAKDKMTDLDYKMETSKLLNSVSAEARNIITSQVEYTLAIGDNDFAAAYRFVYDWMHGKAKSIAGAKKISKRIQAASEKVKSWRTF